MSSGADGRSTPVSVRRRQRAPPLFGVDAQSVGCDRERGPMRPSHAPDCPRAWGGCAWGICSGRLHLHSAPCEADPTDKNTQRLALRARMRKADFSFGSRSETPGPCAEPMGLRTHTTAFEPSCQCQGALEFEPMPLCLGQCAPGTSGSDLAELHGLAGSSAPSCCASQFVGRSRELHLGDVRRSVPQEVAPHRGRSFG